MRTMAFNFQPYKIGMNWQEWGQQEGRVALDAWLNSDEYRAMHHKISFYSADLTNVRIETRECVSAHTSGPEMESFTIIKGFTIIDIATGKRVTREHTRRHWFATEKEAQKELAFMIKTKAQQAAENATMQSHDVATRTLAAYSKDMVSNCPSPTATTQVGDIVQVRGFGKQRAGLVIERTPKRVKCIIRTVESTKRDSDYGYAKWFTI